MLGQQVHGTPGADLDGKPAGERVEHLVEVERLAQHPARVGEQAGAAGGALRLRPPASRVHRRRRLVGEYRERGGVVRRVRADPPALRLDHADDVTAAHHRCEQHGSDLGAIADDAPVPRSGLGAHVADDHRLPGADHPAGRPLAERQRRKVL